MLISSLEKPRSTPQHRRYFGLIRAAFLQWPEKHRFRPDSEEHLRKWLQCSAGYRNIVEVEVPDTDAKTLAIVKTAIAAAMAATKDHAWVDTRGGRVSVIASKSIRYDTLAHSDFDMLCREVEDIIRAETGLDPEQLLTERAA